MNMVGLDIPDTRKTGTSLVAWGGGMSHEAITIGIYSSGGKTGQIPAQVAGCIKCIVGG